MRQTLIITAPFGLGPASKALHVAETLAPHAALTILSSGDAHRFLTAHAPAGTRCRHGLKTEQFTVGDMAAFELIVCIDNAPAARQLCRAGLGSRLVFVDELLQWRAGAGDRVTEGPMQAYLVKDFPGAAQHLARCRAHRVELVAPVVWRSPAASVPERDRAGVMVCFGGGTSPLVRWEHVRPLAAGVIDAVGAACQALQQPLNAIGNAALVDLARDASACTYILGASARPGRANSLALHACSSRRRASGRPTRRLWRGRPSCCCRR